MQFFIRYSQSIWTWICSRLFSIRYCVCCVCHYLRSYRLFVLFCKRFNFTVQWRTPLIVLILFSSYTSYFCFFGLLAWRLLDVFRKIGSSNSSNSRLALPCYTVLMLNPSVGIRDFWWVCLTQWTISHEHNWILCLLVRWYSFSSNENVHHLKCWTTFAENKLNYTSNLMFIFTQFFWTEMNSNSGRKKMHEEVW